MTLAFDLPECPPSFMQRLDPRWKLAAVLLASVAVALVRSVAPALVALAGALILVVLARLPLAWFARRLGTGMLLFALLLIWLPFVIENGHEVLDVGWLQISWTGLMRLIRLSASLCSMLSLLLVMLATSSLPNLFKAAAALRLPRLFVLLFLLAYRYAFLLMEEFDRLRTALRVRGFRNRVNIHSYRTIGQVAGTLLVRSHERSERVAQAMRARGFDGQFRSLDDFSTRLPDVLVFVGVVGYALILVWWDWSIRG
jgi:cobalt/nickel transport system permease protein